MYKRQIIKYEWSWDGDDVWESTETQPLETHTFSETKTHTVMLQVTDDIFRTGRMTMNIRVVDTEVLSNWITMVVGSFGEQNSNSNQRALVTNVAGRPAICWIKEYNFNDDAYVALAGSAEPQDAGDWNSALLAEVDVQVGSLGLVDLGGEAAYLYRPDTPRMRFGTFDGVTITEHTALDAVSKGIGDACLGVVAGKPAIFFRVSDGTPYPEGKNYAYATSASPSSADDWVVNATGITNLRSPSNTLYQLLDFGGLPYLIGTDIDGFQQQILHYASSATPLQADWSYSYVGNHSENDLFRLCLLYTSPSPRD